MKNTLTGNYTPTKTSQVYTVRHVRRWSIKTGGEKTLMAKKGGQQVTPKNCGSMATGGGTPHNYKGAHGISKDAQPPDRPKLNRQ